MALLTTDRADLIAATTMVDNRPPGWWLETPLVEWVVNTFSVLLAGATNASPTLEFAQTIVTVLLFPGPIETQAQKAAERERVRNLVHTLCSALSGHAAQSR